MIIYENRSLAAETKKIVAVSVMFDWGVGDLTLTLVSHPVYAQLPVWTLTEHCPADYRKRPSLFGLFLSNFSAP